MCFNSFYFPCSSLAVGLYVLYLKIFFLKSIMIIIWHPWLPWVSSTVHEDTKVPPPIPVTTFLVKNVSAGFQNINLTALVFLTIALQSLIPYPWVSGTGSDTALFLAEGVLMTFARLMIIMIWQFWLLSGYLMMPGMSPDLVTSSSWGSGLNWRGKKPTVDRLSYQRGKWQRSWHKNDHHKPAVTPDINDLTLRTSGGLLGVTQLVQKVLAIRPAVTLTRLRFSNLVLVVDMSRRSSRIPGLLFLWTPPEFLVATNYFVRRRNLGNASSPCPASILKIEFQIRGHHHGSIEFTWVQPPLLWAGAWAGHGECWGPGAWCVMGTLWRPDDDQDPALCHDCPPTVWEHHPDCIMKKNHSIMF